MSVFDSILYCDAMNENNRFLKILFNEACKSSEK